MTGRPENVDIKKMFGCRLLGECYVQLGPITAPLTSISGDGVR